MTTVAQNIHVFLRESSLHKKHFFEWLKTANFSTACGTVTLKSPPSRGSDAPHVHSRLRKQLSRCTLDCGFKTSESPALRGFVGGLRALATAALYLVLKSNGLRHSKNPPVRFSFSLKIVPATIAKKLPPQRCFKPLLIPIFNFSYKRPTFAFTGESGYTLGFRRRIAHKDSHGETGGVSDGGAITTLGAFHTFRKPCVARCQNGVLCRFWVLVGGASEGRRKPAGQRCAYACRCPEASRPAGLRDLFRFCRNCGLYILRSGLSACARHGWYHYPRRALRASETPDGRLQKQLFCRFLRLGSLH